MAPPQSKCAGGMETLPRWDWKKPGVQYAVGSRHELSAALEMLQGPRPRGQQPCKGWSVSLSFYKLSRTSWTPGSSWLHIGVLEMWQIELQATHHVLWTPGLHEQPAGITVPPLALWQRPRRYSLHADMCIFQVLSWHEPALSSAAHPVCWIQQPQVGEQYLMCDFLPPSAWGPWLYSLLLKVCPQTSSSTGELAETQKFGSPPDLTSGISFLASPQASPVHRRSSDL